jgi:hypothetical protein
MTRIGFLRGTNFNIYSHAERVDSYSGPSSRSLDRRLDVRRDFRS